MLNKNYYSIILIAISMIIGFAVFDQQPIKKEKYPSDWFLMQRAYPIGEVPLEKYYQAIEHTKQIKALNKSSQTNP